MKTEARYREVRRALASEIMDGKYEIGERFPTDLELCARFKCSRHTVREAIRDLQTHGLVERRRGAGTVVSRLGVRAMFSMSSSSLDDVLSNASGSAFEVRKYEEIEIDDLTAKLIGAKEGESWLQISGVRRDNVQNVKLAWAQVYVQKDYFGVQSLLDVPFTSVFHLLEEKYGVVVHGLEQEVSAVQVNPTMAAELDVVPNGPGLSVVRRYFDESDQMFQAAVSLYATAHFSIKSRLLRTDPLSEEALNATLNPPQRKKE